MRPAKLRHAAFASVSRAALLAAVLTLAVCDSAFALTAEDLAARAVAIEEIVKREPNAAEAQARETLAEVTAAFGETSAEAANMLRILGDALFYQDRFAEAEQLFRQALFLREKVLGPTHLDTAISANDLGVVLKQQGRYSEAEPFYRQVVAIREGLLGTAHFDTARAHASLARLMQAGRRDDEAAMQMALAIQFGHAASGPAADLVAWAGERAAMLHDAGDPGAEAAYRSAISAGAAILAPDDLRLAATRQGLGNLLVGNGRLEEAVEFYALALAVRSAAMGETHFRTLALLERLALVTQRLGRAGEAETLFRRLLAGREATETPPGDGVANAARWIGQISDRQKRRAAAEIFYKRALAISEPRAQSEPQLAALDLMSLGLLYSGQQRFSEADALISRALAVLESQPEDEDVQRTATVARSALASLKRAQGDRAGAEKLVRRSLEISSAADPQGPATTRLMILLAGLRTEAGAFAESETLLGRAQAIVGSHDAQAQVRVVTEFGHLRLAQGRIDEAFTLYSDVLARIERSDGPDSAASESAHSNLGRVAFLRANYTDAARHFERAVALAQRAADIDAAAAFAARTGEIEDQAISRAGNFDFLVKTYARLAAADPARSEHYAEKAFTVAQRVTDSRAAGALALMTARLSAGSGELAGLARQRQDLVASWQRDDAAFSGGKGIAAELRQAMAAADARIREIDARLASAFPEFAALQKPTPIDFSTARAALSDNDVLLFFADTGELGDEGGETYLWTVPKHGAVSHLRIGRDTRQLAATIRKLRDLIGVGDETRGAASLVSQSLPDRSAQVLATAAELYADLLAPVGDMIESKNLIVVPSQSLGSLPFHLLIRAVSAPPRHSEESADPYRDAAWLLRDHAIAVLPSVASLTALKRQLAETTNAPREPYLGFANPLLSGRSGSDRRAFDRTGCEVETAASAPAASTVVPSALFDADWQAVPTDIAAIRALVPLPETLDEACAIAGALRASGKTVHQGRDATEAVVKQLSDAAQLASAKVVHFATHALVAGDLPGLVEPAIVLSPPELATERDDGLLTASEVATLKMDADWVILSACNTAASDGSGEVLSGLARAFFYAGARTVMATHWPLNSDAAVRLATDAVREVSAHPDIGRAEALRRAMLAEIDRGGRHAEPSNWAPFVIVGAVH